MLTECQFIELKCCTEMVGHSPAVPIVEFDHRITLKYRSQNLAISNKL